MSRCQYCDAEHDINQTPDPWHCNQQLRKDKYRLEAELEQARAEVEETNKLALKFDINSKRIIAAADKLWEAVRKCCEDGNTSVTVAWEAAAAYDKVRGK